MVLVVLRRESNHPERFSSPGAGNLDILRGAVLVGDGVEEVNLEPVPAVTVDPDPVPDKLKGDAAIIKGKVPGRNLHKVTLEMRDRVVSGRAIAIVSNQRHLSSQEVSTAREGERVGEPRGFDAQRGNGGGGDDVVDKHVLGAIRRELVKGRGAARDTVPASCGRKLKHGC